jgi:hypothetical protein
VDIVPKKNEKNNKNREGGAYLWLGLQGNGVGEVGMRGTGRSRKRCCCGIGQSELPREGGDRQRSGVAAGPVAPPLGEMLGGEPGAAPEKGQRGPSRRRWGRCFEESRGRRQIRAVAGGMGPSRRRSKAQAGRRCCSPASRRSWVEGGVPGAALEEDRCPRKGRHSPLIGAPECETGGEGSGADWGFCRGRSSVWGGRVGNVVEGSRDGNLVAVDTESDGQEIRVTWLSVKPENGIQK